jgi:UDP-N-acetylmuramyl pentapeptide synthase
VPDVVAARARLEARAAYVLRADTFSSAATDSVYAVPIDMAKVFLEHERISVPTQITPFTEGRWGMREIAQSYIAFDTYKVTPYCLTHALRAVLWHNSARKIFIMTEIRPRLITTEALYAPVLEQLARIDEVYYIGDPEVGAYLQSLCAVTQVSVSEVPTLKQSLQARIAAGEALSIGIKTAQYYRLSTLSDW